MFKRAKPMAQRRLAHSDRSGGSAKTAVFGDHQREAHRGQIKTKATAGFYASPHVIQLRPSWHIHRRFCAAR
jgi:hypothetical protein